jgi:hypothetical protein
MITDGKFRVLVVEELLESIHAYCGNSLNYVSLNIMKVYILIGSLLKNRLLIIT